MSSIDDDEPASPTGRPDSTCLFVAADEPLLFFASVRAAEAYLEAVDVRDGAYPAAYGPGGEPFRIGTDGERVVIAPTGEAARPEALKALLTGYFEAVGESVGPDEDLAALVERVRAEEAFWAANDPYGDRFGTAIPPWGCVLFVSAAAAIGYALLG